MSQLKNIHHKVKEQVIKTYYKAKSKYKSDKKLLFKVIGGLILILVVFAWLYNRAPREMSLKEAAKIGETKIYQLLVKIDYNSGGNGGFERGDIILAAAEDKQFSTAEQEGFLIIKVNLSERLSSLLLEQKGVMQRMKETQERKPNKELENTKQKPLRRFYVDMEKVGVKPDEARGRVISDKVFDWQEIIKEK